MSASLYDTDFVRWSEEQADAIRRAATAGANLPLDWENLAEEIESLGRSQRTELVHRARTIIEHLLKLEYSTAADPRNGWRETIRRSRAEIEDLVEDSPSLRRERLDTLARVRRRACDDAVSALQDAGELEPAIRAQLNGGSYTADQVFGRWFPDEDEG